MSEESKKTNLQETRKEKIPDIVEKLTMLVDKTLTTASGDYPTFIDVIDPETSEVKSTSEQQLYHFINVRKEAISNANSMLKQINELERELSDPNYHKKDEEQEETSSKRGKSLKDRANRN